MDYKFIEIEKKWQDRWEKSGIFKAKEEGKKIYVLEMFPYPSGKLHMGHVRNYVIGDAFARFKRMQGYTVLYPMGFDAFGLPAENAAIKHGERPDTWTFKNIEIMKKQMKKLGLSYDWEREIITCSNEYYKWNQFFFLKMFENGLIYRKEAFVNFCPTCKTVLANEQVENGKCWRCKSNVSQKKLKQWFLKTRMYAQRLLDNLDKLEWPENVKDMQREWIGRSEGVEIEFPIENSDKKITVFTTRIDTIYGVTFLVIAPEHELLWEITKKEQKNEVEKFVKEIRNESLLERMDKSKPKRGIFTGSYAINPLNKERVPVYVGEFVIYEYGTGAVMGVPAHDQRDFEFAKKNALKIKVVIKPEKNTNVSNEKINMAYTGEGILINSSKFNGLKSSDARERIARYIEEMGFGRKKIEYKLRDWLISRQRYWGTPIPIIYCEKCGIIPVNENDLPVILPKDVDFSIGGNPLERCKDWLIVKCPICGKDAKRETDTMDTFFDSSWYFLRYCSPMEREVPFNKKSVEFWMPVNLYIGGIEHACMHLIYARFFTMFLKDAGFVNFEEPFQKLLTQGMVLKDGAKMSKSIGNIVDPDEIIKKYGADTIRMFILFASAPEKEMEWSDEGIEGTHRFIRRVWKFITTFNLNSIEIDKGKEKILDKYLKNCIFSITASMDNLKPNTAIFTLMEFFKIMENLLKYSENALNVIKNFLKMLSIFAPHVSEELWERFGENGFISTSEWPKGEITNAFEINYVNKLIEDIENVLKLSRIKHVRTIKIYIAENVKRKFLKDVKNLINNGVKTGDIIKDMLYKYNFDEKFVSTVVLKCFRDRSLIQKIISLKDEINTIKIFKKDLEKRFKCKIEIFVGGFLEKGKYTLPGKPGIKIIGD